MAPRTVLYLTPSSRLLGARRSLLQLTANLDRERYRPVVAVQTDGDLVGALREAGVEVRTLFLGWWRKGRYMLARPWRIGQLAGLAREVGADLIHNNEFFPNPYAVRAARRAGGLPVVTHMRLSITPRRIRNYDLRRADRILCVSRAAARDFEVWPDWRERVEVVYNGVDLDEFQPRADGGETRRAEGLGDGDFVVGLFGLLSPRKRQHLLIGAAARARERIPGLRILIVGDPGPSDGEYAKNLERMVEEKGLAETVRFIPFRKDIRGLYGACDVNALVSDREGFGRTIIEAGALETPSVGSRAGGIPELIVDGETGRLVPAEDDGGAALAACLEELAKDPGGLAKMGRAARKRVEAKFSIERHAAAVMGVYDRVLKEKK